MAYKSDMKTIPADSASVARWGRSNGLVFPYSQARPGDLLIHDAKGDPYNSYGPRGHIGIQALDRGMTYESAGGKRGVGCYPRNLGFWNIAVRHPAFVGDQPVPTPEPEPVEEEIPDMAVFLFRDARDSAIHLKDTAKKSTIKIPGGAQNSVAEMQWVLAAAGVPDVQVHNLSGPTCEALIRD